MEAVEQLPVRSRVRVRPGWVVFLALTAWLAWDLGSTLVFAVRAWGFWLGISDALVIFRLGEALMLLPLAGALLAGSLWAGFTARIPAVTVVRIGALLAALSFIGLYGRIGWAALALVTAFLGLLLAPAAGKRGVGRRIGPKIGFGLLLFFHLLALAANFILHGYAVTPYPAPYPWPFPQRSQAEKQQFDVHYLGTELRRLHADAFHSLGEQAYWTEVARLEAAAPQLSEAEFAFETMRFVASVGDAHTSYGFSFRTPLQVLPVDFAWYGEELYVRGISEDYSQAVGARVTRVGKLRPEELYAAVLPFVSHENEAWARHMTRQYFHVVELLAYIGAVDEIGPVMLALENAAGDAFELQVAPLPRGKKVNYTSAIQQAPYFQNRPDQAFWYAYHADTGTLYFRYAACVNIFGFWRTADEVWKLVEEQPVERMIIDLRGNSGGNSYQFEQFFLPRLKAQAALNDPERLYVLIDGGTYSSGVLAAAQLQAETRATLVGQPTGGSPNGYGEVRSFNLPFSGARINYSTSYFYTMDTDGTTIAPDVLIYPSGSQAFSGQDPVLEYVAPGETWGQ